MLASGAGPNPVCCRIHPSASYLKRWGAFQLHVTPFDSRLDRCVKMRHGTALLRQNRSSLPLHPSITRRRTLSDRSMWRRRVRSPFFFSFALRAHVSFSSSSSSSSTELRHRAAVWRLKTSHRERETREKKKKERKKIVRRSQRRSWLEGSSPDQLRVDSGRGSIQSAWEHKRETHSCDRKSKQVNKQTKQHRNVTEGGNTVRSTKCDLGTMDRDRPRVMWWRSTCGPRTSWKTSHEVHCCASYLHFKITSYLTQ